MAESKIILLWICVISNFILNDQNGSYGSDMHNYSGQAPYSTPQDISPGNVPGATAEHTMSQVPDHVQSTAYQGGIPGFAQTGQQGYPQFQQSYAQAPQNFMPFPQGYGQTPQSYMQAPQGFAPNLQAFPSATMSVAAPIPGYPPGLMPGIDLKNKFVTLTLKGISEMAEISISAVRLQNRDVGSLSDPFCITYLRHFNAPANAWVKFHQSETVMDNLNPHFAEKPLIPPSYADKYMIKFELWDSDLTSSKHDKLGYGVCSLKELLSKQSMTLEMQKSQKTSTKEITSTTSKIIVRVENLVDNNDLVTLHMRGLNMEKLDRNKMGFKSNSDPYIEIYKRTSSAEFILVHRTEVRSNDVNPVWASFSEPIKKLCNAEEERTLKFVCNDWNKKGPKLIGEFSTTMAGLRNHFRNRERLNLMNPNSKRSNKIGGFLEFEKIEVVKRPTFTEFIKRGLKFHVNIAIDFSEANGSLQRPGSLHSLNPNATYPNKYEQAIQSVVTILQDYDYNKSFQVFGFGARIDKERTPNNAFPINPDAPECTGVQGVLSAYRKFLSGGNVTFSRPVLFAPILQKFVETIKTPTMSQDDFFIIVIFTAGEIADINQTEAVIRVASTLAISIIIVGVGDSTGSQFADMEKLDGDHLQKFISGTRAARDIVQFVTLDKHVSDLFDSTASLALAKELLAELPEQVINHMNLHGFMPRDVYGSQPQMYGAPNIYGNMMQPQMMPPNVSGYYAQPSFTAPSGAGYGMGHGAGYGTGQSLGYGAPQSTGYGAPPGPGYGAPQGPGYGLSPTQSYGVAHPQMQQSPGTSNVQSQQMQHSPSEHLRTVQ